MSGILGATRLALAVQAPLLAELPALYHGGQQPRMPTHHGSGGVWASVEANDEEMAAALRSGDEQVARQFCLRFAPLVRRYVARVLGPSDVEDLVQDVFLNFFRSLKRLRDPSKLRYFLMGLAVNVAKYELRKRRVRRLVRLSPHGEVPEAAVAAADVGAASTLRRFYLLLDRLSARDRSIFVLRVVEQMQIEEIAESVGSSVATVRRRLQHVSARLTLWVQRDVDLYEYLRGGTIGGQS